MVKNQINKVKSQNGIKNANARGITLVALVVTIVVLLILAGITIAALFSDNGIIAAAQRASDQTKEAVDKEQKQVSRLGKEIDAKLQGKELPDEKNISEMINKTEDTTKDVYAGKNTLVTAKDNKTFILPEGYMVANVTDEVDKGIVIKDKKGNEFVWVPVPEDKYEEMIGTRTVDGKTLNIGKLYNFTTTGKGTAMSYTVDSGIREPDILRDTSYGDAVTGDANKGIQQLINVVGIKAGANDAETLNNWEKELQKEFDKMAASVKEYKGFYIGRYETGNMNSTTAIPVVQKGNENLGGINWYWQYKNTKTLAANNKVTTSMIWGCQWDRTLDWIANTNEGGYSLLTNSTSWGNYNDSTGEAATGKGSKNPTGNNSAWQKNNIFDMAGNVYDWTIEAFITDYRVYRGGYYNGSGSDSPASNRSVDYPVFSFSYYGSRSTLYVNL